MSTECSYPTCCCKPTRCAEIKWGKGWGTASDLIFANLLIKNGDCVYLVNILPFQSFIHTVSHVSVIQHFHYSICQRVLKLLEVNSIPSIDPHHGCSASESISPSTCISSDPGQFCIVEYGEGEQPICYNNHLECVVLLQRDMITVPVSNYNYILRWLYSSCGYYTVY